MLRMQLKKKKKKKKKANFLNGKKKQKTLKIHHGQVIGMNKTKKKIP